MVWGRIRDAISGVPKLPEGEPTRLPEYFPVEPKGCERHAQKLFTCLANEATEKAREMEKAGFHKSYYKDIPDEKKEAKDDAAADAPTTLPEGLTPNDNPLDECRTLIAYYKRCCDRELKKRKNWILTEPYRVQEEYRYQQGANAQTKKA